MKPTTRYNLTYKSCQESDKGLNFFLKNPEAMIAAMQGDPLSSRKKEGKLHCRTEGLQHIHGSL